MESWCYFSGDKEYVCDKSVSASSENGGKNSGLMGWGLSPSISLENNMECSTHGSIENQESVELSFPQMMRKFFPNDSEKVLHPVIVHPNNAFSEAEEEPSSLAVDSNSRDSSLVDLKLGSTSDQKETLSLNSSISNHNLSYTVAKRPRPGSCSSQMAFCQVYGCRKDLRSSKDYHKRHKVCEVHSKTAKVIVNGVEQRFCQQCSRFHVLVEFDNGKRSCRKRLAGHNERRRKPRVGVNSSRLGWFQDYNGSRFQDTTSTSSIVWQSRHISSLQHQQKYEVDDWNTPVKVEHGVDFSPQIDNPVTSPVTSEQLHSKSLPISYTSGKQHFPLHVGENGALTRSKIDGINELSMQDHFTCSDISSPSLFHNSSVGSKYSMFMDSSSYFQELSGMQNSGHALSLLSSLSQDSSISSSKAHSAHPLVTSDSDSSYDLSKVSQKLLAVSHGPSTTGISKVSNSSWINSTENCLQPLSKHHW